MRKRSDASEPSGVEPRVEAQRLGEDDDETLGDVHFAESTEASDESEDEVYESKSVRFFFSEEPLNYGDSDLEEEDDFDDDFDEDFEVLSDDEFFEFIDGDDDDEGEPCSDDSVKASNDQFDDFDSMNSDENVYESDDENEA